jgi:hypothetical protein
MGDRFVSDALELPSPEHAFDRADLLFYGIDHSGASYEAQVFMAARGIGGEPDRDHRAYVGSWFIFGHGGCFGDVGHCDLPAATDPYDLRPEHPLTPAIRVVTVTDAVRARIEGGAERLTVTVVAHATADNPNDVLAFETVRLATYA